MENASKALIIAGAILLSILIIGLGMRIFSSADSATSGMNLDSQEITAHNSKFNSYEGRQKGSQVSSLLTAIQANNKEYDDRKITVSLSDTSDKYDQSSDADYETEKLFLNGTEKTTDGMKALRSAIKSSTTYNVSFDMADNGLIHYCQIEVYTNK